MDNKRFCLRTDLAEEARILSLGRVKDKAELDGVRAESFELFGLGVSLVEILDDKGSAALNKSKGKYYSLSLPEHYSRGSEDFAGVVKALAELIKRLSGERRNVFVAALGNPEISPDALGHCAADHILVTRHLKGEMFERLSQVSLCRPGVLGSSGMESAMQVKKLCELAEPGLVIAIDALAGSEPERLCKCIQLSDAGISPGSGVGNDRNELSRDSIGVPVISIGIPTVIDAGHFGDGAMTSMFVTPRDIDRRVRDGGRLIAYGINIAIHEGLSIEEVDALIS